ncbi:hypothetical protein NBO_2g0039 [Nosema bombycis CQ1]|uniref:Uncharacterized protein n=1 Tax=Nosema bombycis (strain CQ1 / CVCC 102059) TaxID=578461 RepID=R0KZB3_NOSB1|nr:hypothetical protein NBO_2g0039 [Nosema bombycis CQ1]|eukprot:EOB15547.1 hypothetical protein NBO_2g0039 [Nosema bombycis CQ1]
MLCFFLIVKCMTEIYPGLEDEVSLGQHFLSSEDLNSETLPFETKESFDPRIQLKTPKNATRSIRYGKIKTNPENLETLIQNEMHDISPDLHYKISKKLEQNTVDRNKFRDLFLIKKRVIQDGKKKIISFNIKEKIIPKTAAIEEINKDFGLRAMLAGIVFLLAGLVFTTTMKMYQSMIKTKYVRFEKKGGESEVIR